MKPPVVIGPSQKSTQIESASQRSVQIEAASQKSVHFAHPIVEVRSCLSVVLDCKILVSKMQVNKYPSLSKGMGTVSDERTWVDEPGQMTLTQASIDSLTPSQSASQIPPVEFSQEPLDMAVGCFDEEASSFIGHPQVTTQGACI